MRKIETHRGNSVALELLPDLRLSGQERSQVRGIPCAAFDVESDGCSMLNVADVTVAVELNVGPVFRDFGVQCLELGHSLGLVLQVASRLTVRLHVFRLLRLEFDDLSGIKLVGGIAGGRIRNILMTPTHMTTGPRLPLLFLSRRSVGEEASRVDGRPVNLPILDQVTILGTDGVPDTIDRGVIDSTKRLDRGMGESAGGLGEQCIEIRTGGRRPDADIE